MGFVTGVPSDGTVVLTDNDGEPTWVEYNHGLGRVIVTTLTYCVTGQLSRGVVLRNLLAYSRFYFGLAQTPGLTATPTNTPTTTATGPTRTPTSTRTATFTRPPTATITPTPMERGDLNDDGLIDALDLAALIAALFDSNPPAAADVNDDSRVSAADVPALIESIAAP
jgi:hypothetical protein